MQGLRTLTNEEIEKLMPGDVLILYEASAKEIFGKTYRVCVPRMVILQANENHYLFFHSADGGSHESAQYKFYVGMKFAKLTDDQHPPVINEGFGYRFLVD